MMPKHPERLWYVQHPVTRRWLTLAPMGGVGWSETCSAAFVVRFETPQEATWFVKSRQMTEGVIVPHPWNYYHKTAYPKRAK